MLLCIKNETPKLMKESLFKCMLYIAHFSCYSRTMIEPLLDFETSVFIVFGSFVLLAL